MKSFSTDLYDFCNSEVKKAINNFCDQINHSDADILIIMAHKAVLLFQILLEQGYINRKVTEKVIITHLALGFDCKYLRGQKIAILDDVVISGTSIASTVNKLLSFGVNQDDIEVIAIATDLDYMAMKFDNTKGISVLRCDYQLGNASCIELSAIISKVLSYFGVPYDVDFPVYEGVFVSAEQLNALHNNLFWDVIDISNGNQQAGGVTVFTVSPTQLVRRKLWASIGVELEKCTDIKIRLYVVQYPDGTYECRIVPMCLFREISLDSLGILYDRLKPTEQTISLDTSDFSISQMRYLEFVISHQLYKIFSDILSLEHRCMFHENNAKQLFGPTDGETVYRQLCSSTYCCSDSNVIYIDELAVDNSTIIEKYKKSNVYEKVCEESINWEMGNEYQRGCWINRFILSPILWWHYENEKPIREDLKKEVPHYVKDHKKIEPYLFRLKNGLPMSVLQSALNDRISKISDTETERVISVFLDRAIDEGIIVPTIYYNKDRNYLCRAYRHGEDLPFALADQYRLVYFLHSIGKCIHMAESERESDRFPSVAGISLEKMIVLFYQMGLKQGHIFNRFLGFDNTEIIRSFLSVHGVIQGYTASNADIHIYSERDSEGNRYITWLTTWLYEIGLIGKKLEYADEERSNQPIPINLENTADYLEENESSAASETVLRNIDSLAELISTWYNVMAKSSKKVEFRDNIIALTSCANGFVYASAIATEIHYFFNYWRHQGLYALEEVDDSQRLVGRLTDSDENKRYTSIITQGLHSGRDKIIWKNAHRAQGVIKEVKSFLNSTGANLWAQIWSGVDLESDHPADDLKIHTHVAEGFLYFLSACFECLKSREFWESGSMPIGFSDFKDHYLALARCTRLLDDSLFDALEDIAKLNGSKLRDKEEKFKQLVSEGLFSSEQCVNKIEEIIRKKDPTYTVRYKSALILDITPLNYQSVEEALMRFWDQLPEDADKTMLNLIRFPQDLDSPPFVKYGIFFGENALKPLDSQPNRMNNDAAINGKLLYKAFQSLCSILSGKLYQIRGILLPHIIPGSRTLFQHNLQRNIAQNAKEFYTTIIKPLESCYDDVQSMQLVLASDHHVDRQFHALFEEWNSVKVNHIVREAEWVTNCIVYSKDIIRFNGNNVDLLSKIAYSQLKVSCGQKSGLGILLRHSEQIVCISCNHIFVDFLSCESASAMSTFSPNIKFELKPLTEIHQYQSDEEILPAGDEIIVLEPCWGGNIPFEISNLISIEDIAHASLQMSCMCYGCNDKDQMTWIDSLHVAGPIGNGYYQINGEINKITPGFSGGIYVGTNPQNDRKIIGLHEGRFFEGKDGYEEARMIPWSSIETILSKI